MDEGNRILDRFNNFRLKVKKNLIYYKPIISELKVRREILKDAISEFPFDTPKGRESLNLDPQVNLMMNNLERCANLSHTEEMFDETLKLLKFTGDKFTHNLLPKNYMDEPIRTNAVSVYQDFYWEVPIHLNEVLDRVLFYQDKNFPLRVPLEFYSYFKLHGFNIVGVECDYELTKKWITKVYDNKIRGYSYSNQEEVERYLGKLSDYIRSGNPFLSEDIIDFYSGISGKYTELTVMTNPKYTREEDLISEEECIQRWNTFIGGNY